LESSSYGDDYALDTQACQAYIFIVPARDQSIEELIKESQDIQEKLKELAEQTAELQKQIERARKQK
jgi:peptidoglycan hydrolase CwlO-like protein